MTYFAITRTDNGYVTAWPRDRSILRVSIRRRGLTAGEIRTPGTNGMRNGLVALGAPITTLVAWKNKDVLS
jgi:hypothetical protein